MKLFRRRFSGEPDKDKMIALARQTPASSLHVVDLPYRLSSWSLDDPDHVALWVNGKDELMGLAILQTPFWTIDFVCHPSAESKLHSEFLVWADERARATSHTPTGHPAWYVMVFEEQAHRIHDLELAGFQCQADVGEASWSKVLMRRSKDTVVKVYQPPPGYQVRSLAGEQEAEAYVALHQSVFESNNMTVDWRLRTLKHPAYKRDLDIVVESPEGDLVAFCIGWLNETSLEGQIEPVGCHKNFRHHALGRVAFSEGLARLQSLGSKDIFVETDRYRNTAFRLYESFDFQVFKNVLVFRKDYED
jgi:ribosomal protein S18 acetylase RimI-like enzyme